MMCGNFSTPDYPTAGTGGVYALSLQTSLCSSICGIVKSLCSGQPTHTADYKGIWQSHKSRKLVGLGRVGWVWVA